MTEEYIVINPYNQEEIGRYQTSAATEVATQLATLQRGRRVLAALSAHERAVILRRLAALLDEHAEPLARVITEEVGKTLQDSRVELQRSASTVRCAADESTRIGGEVLDADAYPPRRGKWGIVRREPLGVVLAITPFNFPFNLALHKIAPAFAAGCPLLFKPHPQNYLSGQKLTALCYEAGMPEEAIQCCQPSISVLSDVIAGDDVQVVSFTGGVPTAKAIARNAGIKKLLFELGGNDPLIVMPDADLSLAAKTVVGQRFATAGQRCTAAKRVFVHDDVYETFTKILRSLTEALVVGDPMKEETFVGPVFNAQAADLIERRIQEAVAAGATLLHGGTREGNVIAPTILADVPISAEICADETFGPVVPLFRFSALEELIEMVNRTEFGLQAGVFTDDLAVIKGLYAALEVGALAVNDGPGFRAEHFPFGGVKMSGLGREGVRYAIEEMTFLKTLIL